MAEAITVGGCILIGVAVFFALGWAACAAWKDAGDNGMGDKQ